MNLYQQLSEIEDQLSEVDVYLGNPNRRHLLIRATSTNSSRETVIEDTLILPKPYVKSMPHRLVGMNIGNSSTAITVTNADLYVEISRSKALSLFIPTNTSRVIAILDVPVDSNNQPIYSNLVTKEIQGIKFRVIHVMDDDEIIFNLLLRREKD